jgi:predicted nucleic acid-binding protein
VTFIDSNIFLRYITRDDARAQLAAAEVLARIARGEDEGWTTAVHVHETVYVLASRRLYNVPHVDIRDRLRPLLLLRGLKLRDKRLCLEALDIFAAHGRLDYADALAVAVTRRHGLEGIYSFDKHFDTVPGIRRLEP